MDGRGEWLIALLTDFGTRDPYVAAMKAVITARTRASLLDLTHEIAPFDVFEAAIFLRGVVPYLPPERVVIVAVVDPGVGTARRIIAARDGGRCFFAPDNGLLPLVVGADAEVRSVENGAWFLPRGSNTFHGRDRFAPVAAAIANGERFDEVGPLLEGRGLQRFDYQPPVYGTSAARGAVIAVDRFGNLITDIEVSRLGELADWSVRVGGQQIDQQAIAYGEAPADTPFVIAGSRGTIEISVANESAAELLQIERFATVDAVRRSRNRE